MTSGKSLQSLLNIFKNIPNSIQELQDFALEEALKLTDSKIGHFYKYNENLQQLRLLSFSQKVFQDCSLNRHKKIRPLDEPGICTEAIRKRKPLVINDYQKSHPLKKGISDYHINLNRYMGIPIFKNNNIVAVVGMANKEEDYTENDLLRLQIFMDYLWEVREHKELEKELYQIKQVLSPKHKPQINTVKNKNYTVQRSTAQSITSQNNARYKLSDMQYGDLTKSNTRREILEATGKDLLHEISMDFVKLLETTALIFEKNGDYALGLFASDWCRFLNKASRNLCSTNDNWEAMQSGHWLCHESCWRRGAKHAIDTGQPVDKLCYGGIRIHAVPIQARGTVVGAISMSYGDPPQDLNHLQDIADSYQVDLASLWEKTKSYDSRPSFIIDIAQERLYTAARLIGYIMERKKAENQLHYLSYHDKLTGLYNRDYIDRELNNLSGESNLPLSIIMTDVNGLKLVNESYGNETGNQILTNIANLIEEIIPEEGIAARWGGDEFIIILPKTSKKQAENISANLKRKCDNLQVTTFPVKMALGVATATKTATSTKTKNSLKETIKSAEDRMYKNKLGESESTKSDIIGALLATLKEKSDETEAHARRLRELGLKFGTALGLSRAEKDRLSLLATMHDIGKVVISEDILKKSGPLTEDEWEKVKEHPEIGQRIAYNSDNLNHIAEEIASHHERWDGKGYPRGLQGKEIPLLARVISIIDTFDVITQGRSYKRAVSKQQAIAEIKRCAGTQFDPELVEIFTNLVEEC
ncbi:HD domain-containing phosphohydrolase [Natranaerobius thermophilus]|uniref:Diguanylate cyclase and metal dependent phosphohydrolase n=1 Tax=Natranaerobius thermophilus (strain ATCC BAA-1301 / DSM 18059 / JW/NM-WN-LF) TaxID=457570 RepID=B2A0U2_NATTJ|nr:HD domain-containing phosphohydrolase [Natranaerobius thermophilus]ACB85972.1 diguanylate cyclase and metal dependent phosphohydrolase [Natranaerobius thermophilus JW/NM-WN-LF]